MHEAEVAVIFNPKACSDSENAQWEIDLAKSINKPTIHIQKNHDATEVSKLLLPHYDLVDEFSDCFSENLSEERALELYKIMIDSSESLIQRRQKTSAFFITVIGSLLAIAGLIVKSGALNSETIWLMYGFGVTGLLLCNSWRGLISNYGKLNKAKFDVILRLEHLIGARVFQAEWVSLGKGLRPEKYKSFTHSERNVPTFFAILIFSLLIIAIGWHWWG